MWLRNAGPRQDWGADAQPAAAPETQDKFIVVLCLFMGFVDNNKQDVQPHCRTSLPNSRVAVLTHICAESHNIYSEDFCFCKIQVFLALPWMFLTEIFNNISLDSIQMVKYTVEWFPEIAQENLSTIYRTVRFPTNRLGDANLDTVSPVSRNVSILLCGSSDNLW